MELRDALGQISEIREQMVRSSVFRGYRALPIATTGLLAVGGAITQSLLIPEPTLHVRSYLKLWILVAILSVVVAGTEMLVRYLRSTSPLARDRTRIAIGQFAPCLLAGIGMTLVLSRAAPEHLWVLPGLWAVTFSLGLFASRLVLPRAFVFVASFYLCAGLASLLLATGERAFSPLAMAIPFGTGQLLAAAVLYWTLERDDGEATDTTG
jgi:hypothetical protein